MIDAIFNDFETISIQNIDFFDVAIDEIDEIIKEISKNECFEIIFEKIIDNVNINVDSFRDKNITKNVNIAIIAFDVEIDVRIAIIANSFRNEINVNIASSFDADFANSICCCTFFESNF